MRSAKRSDPPLSPAASTENINEAAGFKKRDGRAHCSGVMLHSRDDVAKLTSPSTATFHCEEKLSLRDCDAQKLQS